MKILIIFLIILGSFSNLYALPSPKVDYHFDECSWDGTADEVKDSGGDSRDGTSYKNAQIKSGKINNSGYFTDDGSDNSYVKLKSALTGVVEDSWTFTCWVKIVVDGTWQPIFFVPDDSSSKYGFMSLWYNSDSGNESVSLWVNNGDNVKVNMSLDNQWHFMTLTYDGSDIKLYIDKDIKIDTDYEHGMFADTKNFYVGIGRKDGVYTSNTYIDEVKIFDTPLTSTDINTIYDNENSGKNYDGSSRTSVDCSANANAFITTWKTDNSGSSNSTSIEIPMIGDHYDVDWDNDGTIDQTDLSGPLSHDYGSAGTYTVSIHHSTPRIQFNPTTGDKDKIISIEQWGTGAWTSMYQAFYGCSNLESNATDVPDLSGVTTMYYMFSGASKFNSDLNNWDVSNIGNMGSVFFEATLFDGNISNWNVSKVTDMSSMFNHANNFNQDISDWDVSKVIKMNYMFGNTTNFNQDISGWDVSKVTNMYAVFKDATNFNQNISGWDVSSATSMHHMFENATSFDQDIGNWDVSSVTNMTDMFNGVTLSTNNYDSLLIGWNDLDLVDDLTFSGGNSKYCAGENARNNKLGDNWTITDSNIKDCSMPTPVIDYHFDECLWDSSPSEVIDTSGNFNATAKNGATSSSGVLNHGGYFDGTNDYIDIPNISTDFSSGVTISAWARFDTSEDSQRIIELSTGEGKHGIVLSRNGTDDKIVFEVYDGYDDEKEDDFNDYAGLSTTSDVIDGKLHHYAVTLSSSGDAKIYVDGTEVKSKTFSYMPENVTRTVNYIAKSPWSGDAYFGGLIDEVKVFQGALTSTQIGSIFISEVSKKNYDGTPRIAIFCPNDLVADYRFDKCTVADGDVVEDNSTNGKDGTYHTTTFQTALINQSVDLTADGITDYVTLDDTAMNGLNDFTVSLWMKTQDSGDSGDDRQQIIQALRASDHEDEFGIYVKDSEVVVKVKNNQENISLDLTDGAWHHILFNRSRDIGDLYVDGVWKGQKTGIGSDALTVEAGSFLIGQEQDEAGGNFNAKQDFEGYVDEVKVFKIALAPNQIKTIYNNEGNTNPHKNYDGSTRTAVSCSANAFITTWRTTTADETITIPTTGSGYNYIVDWGDGNTDTGVTGDATHTYSTEGNHTVKIYGDFPRIYFNNGGDKEKIISINQWGTGAWTKMSYAFYGCSNLESNATDAPDLSGLTNMHMFKMFSGASKFNANLNDWDVSNITVMNRMFDGATSFDQDLGDWNVSSVTDMENMFNGVKLSTNNYDSLLIGWNALDLKEDVKFSGGNSNYCAGEDARTNMINPDDDNWNITDGGKDCSMPTPVVDYHFDECSWNGSSEEIKDSSGNNQNGISYNNAQISSGKINTSGHFTKDSNENNSSAELSLDGIIKDSWTFTFWVKIETNGARQPIFFIPDSSGTLYGYLSLYYNKDSSGTQYISFWNDDDLLDYKSIPLDDNTWYFVTVSYDGTAIKLYIDGESELNHTYDNNLNLSDSKNFFVGKGRKDGLHTSNMDIDEVKVFNIALAQKQIQTIYDNEGNTTLHKNYDGSHRMVIDCTTPTILAEYRFDECKYTGDNGEVKDTNLSTGDNSGTIPSFDTTEISTTKDSGRKSGRVLKLDGGVVDINISNISTEKYKKNTVMFWMYWDGTNNVLPFYWNKNNSTNEYNYGLWIDDSKIGFNTWNTNDTYRSSSSITGWKHITAVFTNGDIESNRLYIDGEEKGLSQINTPDLSHSYAGKVARIAGVPNQDDWQYQGYLDELKIYKGELNATTIASIHDYEKNILDRNITCAQAIFNAVNRAGGCFNWDNNITTKIVGADINLTILSADKNEANASLTDVNITQLDLLSFTDPTCEPSSLYDTTEIWHGTDEVNSTTACWNPPSTVFTHPKAVRCARIKITGIYDGAIVESNSSDTFSIRPDKFVLSSATDLTQKLIAERDYTFWVKAVDIDGNVTDDFNTSVTQTSKKYFRDNSDGSSMDGDFKPNNSFVFSDGITAETNLSFSNVGKLSLDLNDTNWTITDDDDTLLIDRTIFLEQNLTFRPDRFDINFTNQPYMQNHENESFTYYANDLENMAAVLKDINFTITALGEKGGVMSNYQNPQDTWFANDTNFSLGLDVDQNPTLFSPDIDDINETNVVKDLNFSSGVATLGYEDLLFNFGRERNVTQNPRFLNGADSKLNITAIDNIDVEVNGTKVQDFDGNASFYYGRVRAKDIKTSDTTADANATIQVYSSSALSGFEQESSSWYVHKLDSFTVIGERNETKRKLTTDANISTFNITKGRGGFEIQASPTDKSYKKFYHLSIPTWLWYSRYEDYNYTTGATCGEHPCFEYIFEYADEGKGIKSGSFKGAKFKDEFKSGVKKRAVKILR